MRRYASRMLCAAYRLTQGTVITLMVFAVASDTLKMRSPFIGVGLLLCLIGFAINISDAAMGVKYFGTFLCVSGSYSAITGIVAW